MLPADSLTLAVSTELLPPESDGQRFLGLHVGVSNPTSQAVLISVTGNPGTPPTFGYDLRGPSGGISASDAAVDSSMLFFQPFETKTWLYEFRITSELTEHRITPGFYFVRGGYARRWSPFDTILVSP